MVCEGFTSRLDVVHEILNILGMKDKVKVIEVTSDYFKNEYFAERPLSERLVNKKLNLRNINVMQNWQDALKEYLNSEYLDYLVR
jgi:dTDP-4-dehydrorhamnose reductase